MSTLALYGMFRNRPRWFIEKRGMYWLKSGFCPCCYSSPPNPNCSICHGDYRYGPDLPQNLHLQWGAQWLWRCEYWERPEGKKEKSGAEKAVHRDFCFDLLFLLVGFFHTATGRSPVVPLLLWIAVLLFRINYRYVKVNAKEFEE